MIEALSSVASYNALGALGQTNESMSGMSVGQMSSSIVEKGDKVSFDQVLSEVVGVVGTKLQNAENFSVSRIVGNDVGVREVVNSVMEAERSLSIAIALRDKLVQAYLEISRMQI